jgi:hypothetical protein
MKSCISFDRDFYDREGEKWEERNSKRLAYEIILFHYLLFLLHCFIDFSAEEDEEGGDIQPKHEDDDGT